MLQLIKIVKDYETAGESVHALRDVSLDFRDSEFVAILGQSGCGKTTLLNIIGGLDRYTSGDLVIDGRSTNEYKDSDWDSYRNHAIGFVFQSYNLIMHQSVLSNVEMALKLSGAGSVKRREKATEALMRVGLADQMNKKPAMMSGGQMQRVAIARALVNDPSVVLADEPTGALDSQTSVQIMDLLAEVAKDRLVIMVTHNPELAEKYASRIIRLKDGEVVSDSNPPGVAEAGSVGEGAKPPRSKLGFLTALGLSFSNLLTKKGRTILTSFAGAIGIIGIALILALSTGMNDYISQLETDTMGSYPIELEKETIDLSTMMDQQDGAGGSATSTDSGGATGDITSSNVVADSVKTAEEMSKTNDLGAFKKYLLAHEGELDGSLKAVEYGYDVTPQVYRRDDGEGLVQVSPATLEEGSSGSAGASDGEMGGMSTMLSGSLSSAWTQIADNEGLREATYTLQAGEWPDAADEAALVIDEDGQVSDYTLYTLGLMDIGHMNSLVEAVENGENYEDPQESFSFDEVLGLEYKVLAQSDLYEKNEDGVWVDRSDDEEFILSQMEQTGLSVRIVGVLSISEDSIDTDAASGVVYTGALTSLLMDKADGSEVVQAQLADSNKNVLTGDAFDKEDDGGDGASDTGSNDDGETTSQACASIANSGADASVINAAGRQVDGIATVKAAVYRPASSAPASSKVSEHDKATAFQTGVLSLASDATGSETEGSSSDDASAGEDEDGDSAQHEDFTVRFLNYDGSVLQSSKLEDGAEVTLPEENPTRSSDASYTYAFLGWRSSTTKAVYTEGEVPFASEDVDYVAYYYAVATGGGSGFGDTAGGGESSSSGSGGMDGSSESAGAAYPLSSGSTDASGAGSGSLSGISTLVSGSSGTSDASSTMGTDMSSLEGSEDLSSMSDADISAITGSAAGALSDAQMQALLAQMSDSTPSTYGDVLSALGYTTEDEPSSISLYPTDFDGKTRIEDFIAAYNDQVQSEAQKVTYTDMIATMTSMLTSVVDIISYVLIAFTAISLVVSSIMIAIITWISVLERVKEIGILRAMGASKGDVSRIFNAETVIEGLLSGAIGVGVTLLLCLPINAVISSMFEAEGIASLPPAYAVALIALSVALTFIAGFIPARMAARKDPVAALRSE